jgi:hypothetical protein
MGSLTLPRLHQFYEVSLIFTNPFGSRDRPKIIHLYDCQSLDIYSFMPVSLMLTHQLVRAPIEVSQKKHIPAFGGYPRKVRCRCKHIINPHPIFSSQLGSIFWRSFCFVAAAWPLGSMQSGSPVPVGDLTNVQGYYET